MNTLERRRMIRDQLVDVSIAKVAVNQSRRQRSDATKKLRKVMAAGHLATIIKSEMISYPRHAVN